MSRSRSSRDEKDRDRKSDRKRSSSRRDRSPSPEESREERLLRKAKEYVEKEKRKTSSRRSKSPSEERSRKHHRHDDEGSKRSSRKSSKKSRRGNDELSGSEDDHRKRSSHRREDKSSRKRRHRSPEGSGGDSEESQRDRKKQSISKEKSKKHKKDDHKHSRKKEDKKESKKDKKKKGRSNDDKHKKKAVKPDKSKLVALGSPPGKPPAKLLDPEEDYFSFHQSLWVWLYREEGVAFNDLTSDESREAFDRFAKQYNAGKLEAAYYDEKGLPPVALEECKTTRHKWTFQTSETERKGLQMLQDGVRKLTEYSDTKNNPNAKKEAPRGPSVTPAVAPRAKNEPEEEGDDGSRRAWTAEERMAQRVTNRRLREHVRTADEEFGGGRADPGRDRQLQKKKETAAKIHGASRDKEDMGVTIGDDALYGDGGHGASFQAALARERKRKTQREESKQARIQELQQKEQNKQQAMLDMLGMAGLKPGQKIKIAPRKDGD